MNAYELAKELDEYNADGFPVFIVEQAANMLRQQSDRIAELEVYEKQIKKITSRRALVNFLLGD